MGSLLLSKNAEEWIALYYQSVMIPDDNEYVQARIIDRAKRYSQ